MIPNRTEISRILSALALLVVQACSDEEGNGDAGVADAATDATSAIRDSAVRPVSDAQAEAASAQDGASADAANADDANAEDATVEAGSVEDQQVARGEYLALHVSNCVFCHTPGAAEGQPDPDRLFGGVDCFIDADRSNDSFGCVNTANLTNHETGLKNRSDAEIKRMIQEGVRPNGEALHSVMPYWVYANMSDEDADAIVAYLRSLPPVDHTTAPNQPPFFPPLAPSPPLAMGVIPEVPRDYTDPEAAERGRYLATQVSLCLQCHTPEVRTASPPIDQSKIFHGGSQFEASGLGLPTPPFPDVIYSSNLTPDESTGLGTWTVDDIAKVLIEGVRPDGTRPCPPMPSGPNHAFGGMTQADARDIGHYLLSLTPVVNAVQRCEAPAGP